MKFPNILKLVFYKNKYIDELCDYYGNPQDVLENLQFIANKHKAFKIFIRKDIEYLEGMVEIDYQNYLTTKEQAQEKQGGCYDCPWGDGEGGCTIPGYCNA